MTNECYLTLKPKATKPVAQKLYWKKHSTHLNMMHSIRASIFFESIPGHLSAKEGITESIDFICGICVPRHATPTQCVLLDGWPVFAGASIIREWVVWKTCVRFASFASEVGDSVANTLCALFYFWMEWVICNSLQACCFFSFPNKTFVLQNSGLLQKRCCPRISCFFSQQQPLVHVHLD